MLSDNSPVAEEDSTELRPNNNYDAINGTLLNSAGPSESIDIVTIQSPIATRRSKPPAMRPSYQSSPAVARARRSRRSSTALSLDQDPSNNRHLRISAIIEQVKSHKEEKESISKAPQS